MFLVQIVGMMLAAHAPAGPGRSATPAPPPALAQPPALPVQPPPSQAQAPAPPSQPLPAPRLSLDGAAAARPPALPAPTAPRAAAPVPDDVQTAREELALWLRVKDSGRPEEIEAFLTAFPDGRLANLARRKLAELRGAPQQAQPPQPQGTRPTALLSTPPAAALPPPAVQTPAPSAPFVLNRATIAEAQERLYGLNYYSGPINGNAGKPMREALTQYQTRVGLVASGVLDETTMTRLRASQIPNRWAALAFTARGAYGAAWHRATRKQAETDAMQICKRNARGQACKMVVAPLTACMALSTYEARSNVGDRRWGAYAATRASRNEARIGALDLCRQESVVPDKCEVKVMVCGDTGQET